MKKILFIIIFVVVLVKLNSLKVILIENPPYSGAAVDNNISYFLMQKIVTDLGLDFNFEYKSHLDAMKMIDNEEDVLIFPFIRPKILSNRILISDTVFVNSHKIFYNSLIYSELQPKSLNDLRTYVIGSNAFYPYETNLRKSGLTVHYSRDNIESMQKLVDQEVSFVIEERLKGLNYLKQIEAKNKINISYFDVDLFPEPFFICAPVKNSNAVEKIELINKKINDKNYINSLLDEYFKNF